jgi:hypothetical protein
MYLPVQAEEMHTTTTPTEPTDPTDPTEATATQEGPVIITVADGTVADGTLTDGTVADATVTDVTATNTVVETTLGSAVESPVGLTVVPMAGDVPALAGT